MNSTSLGRPLWISLDELAGEVEHRAGERPRLGLGCASRGPLQPTLDDELVGRALHQRVVVSAPVLLNRRVMRQKGPVRRSLLNRPILPRTIAQHHEVRLEFRAPRADGKAVGRPVGGWLRSGSWHVRPDERLAGT